MSASGVISVSGESIENLNKIIIMKIELTTEPSKEDAKKISQGLTNYNHQMVPELEDTEIKFFIFARDENDVIIGGLRAVLEWDIVHIELLWTSEEARGKGIGKELMEKAEAYALEKGIDRALLETTSFQARPFYEKLGYEVFGTLPDHPKGHDCYFLTKKLR